MVKKPTAQAQYIEHLIAQLDFAQQQITLMRQDVEFYRGKVERLELAIMSNVPAQQEYVQTQTVVKPPISEVRKQPVAPPRIPFTDLRRQWMAMSAEEQEKAMQDGWQLEQQPKEEEHAGK